MKTIYLGILLLFTLISCNSSTANFNRMSSTEIAAYNQTVGTWDQFICRELDHIQSRIPRRRCDTRWNWQQGIVRAVDTLVTADPGKLDIEVN